MNPRPLVVTDTTIPSLFVAVSVALVIAALAFAGVS